MAKLKHLYLNELEKSLQANSCVATCLNDELLKKIAGKNLAVYFYINNDTEECNLISKDLANFFDVFKKYNTEIIGISKDSIESHYNFKDRENLPFELISDCNNVVSKAFKVGQDSTGIAGIKRKTFLFSSEGVLLNEWRNTDANGHAKSVLAMINNMGDL